MAKARSVDDEAVAALLTHCAVLDIRRMARRRRALSTWPDDDYVACIAWLADLVHNIALGQSREPRWMPWRKRRGRMRWTWRTADPAGRAWILSTLEKYGMAAWIPPLDADEG
ncbi:hypothetical protein [Streptomyces aureus]|uniref:hypothetical protein n=1 Tax=Streptomyces aureus TaxID=193461 RepID=UPI003406191C